MRVVLDTNVLVSGLLKPASPAAQIIRLSLIGKIEIAYDERIITEYGEVLRRPRFPFTRDQVETLLAEIRRVGISLVAEPNPISLPDPDDEPFLEMAWTARARAIVTGNKKHFPSRVCRGLLVLSPREFLDFFRKTIPAPKRKKPTARIVNFRH